MKTLRELTEAEYVNSDVLQVTGLKLGTLQMWLARGLVSPTVENETRGTRRRYSAADIMRLYALSKITELGFSVSDSSEICASFFGPISDRKILLEGRVAESWLIATRGPDGKIEPVLLTCDPYLSGVDSEYGPEAFVARLAGGKPALVVHIGALIAEAFTKIKELES